MLKINDAQKHTLQEIAQSHNLRFIILHGSYAKGTHREGSDLDIAILGNRPLPMEDIFTIHGELGEIFGDNKERELDLKSLQGVDPLFRFEVLRGGILLYGNQSNYDEFKIYAYRDYMDSYDLRKLESILLKKGIQSLSKRYAQ